MSEGEAWAFDDSFFGVPPAEARSMDLQQRMMLEVSKSISWWSGLLAVLATAMAAAAAAALTRSRFC